MKNSYLMAPALLLAAWAPIWAEGAPNTKLSCDRPTLSVTGLVNACKIVETPTSFSGSLTVTTPLGGVRITGWDQPDVLVRSQIESVAPSYAEAEALNWQVQANVLGDRVTADGPPQVARHNWSVTFEIFVPRAADLTVDVRVGGITIADVKGTIRFSVGTGGVNLARLSGDVQGSVNVGGICVVLDGDHWDGLTLSVKTNVGGIEFQSPAQYSAHFVLTAGLGSIKASFLGGYSAPAKGFSLGDKLTFDAGSGGATIAVETNVGGIAIRGL